MIVTIDGPAGAGKSTLAKALAKRMGFQFLDTGAMYRTVALIALRKQIASDDEQGMRQALDRSRIEVSESGIFVDGEDVGQAIRTPETTAFVRHVADMPSVRKSLSKMQREAAKLHGDIVTEGRDQGTIVFPDAQCKFFLTASPEARARRRLADYEGQGHAETFEKVLADQIARDSRDQQRVIAPLKPASDAIIVDSSDLTIDETLEVMERAVRERANVET